ncbi:MAG: 6-carboxytetrahydropterin synthase [Bacteroidales bacterium]
MGKLSITKIFSFEAAHALKNYDGLCANIHGHSYKLEVTVHSLSINGNPGDFLRNEANPKCGMILDFGDLKKCVNQYIIEEFDHALILNKQTDPSLIASLQKNYQKILVFPFQPTSENLLLEFASRLLKNLPINIHLAKIRLYETSTSFTDWENE